MGLVDLMVATVAPRRILTTGRDDVWLLSLQLMRPMPT